jgi:hypothetical protein
MGALLFVSCAQPRNDPSDAPSQSSAAPASATAPAATDTGSAAATTSSFSDKLDGRVIAGGKPIAKATVTLWAASRNASQQIAQSTTDDDGRFSLSADDSRPSDSILYLVAKGGIPAAHGSNDQNPAIGLLAVLGQVSPEHVVVNELTTIGSVWTAAQLFDGTGLRGSPLSLRIAAGNVANLADVKTGGIGSAVQDPLNSTETTTLATLGTLADLISGCATEVQTDACSRLFAAGTPRGGTAPADTLAVAEAIALHPAAQPKLFALLGAFYPLPPSPRYPVRPAPYVPYLEYAPSAWTLALKFSGGGLSAPGKIAIDRDGNVWTGDNFIVGDQASWNIWNGNLTELAPNGRAISPITTGFTGGGIFGPGFGTAIDQMGRVWISNNQPGASVSVFDKNGKPLSPADGLQIKPFNFMLACHVRKLGHPIGTDPGRFHLVAPYEPNATRWTKTQWIDQYSDRRYRIDTHGAHGTRSTARAQTYGDVLREYEMHPEAKCADALGRPCSKRTIGLLQRRQVLVDRTVYIGKESNRLEDAEAGLLHDTESAYTEYPDPRRDEWATKILPALRKMKVSRLMAETGLSRATIQAIRGGRRPHRSKRVILDELLGRLGIAL